MELFFGIAADGRTYPDASAPPGAVDFAVVGPAGLTDTLEVQLGIAGPAVPRSVRIAAYVAKIRAAGVVARFWSDSFSKDPWSTATMLLSLRDELVAGGWSCGPVGVERIDDLAEVEIQGAPLPRGLADRVAALIPALSSRPGLRLVRLCLLEARSTLPPLWKRLIDAFESVGVAIIEHTGRTPATEGTDLRRVQKALDGDVFEPLAGDGSVALVEADTALMAAEAVADWLAAGPATSLDGTVVLAPDGDTALLDGMLNSRGLPALGLSARSPWRGALQVLPLAFAVAWRPFDPKALLNLLMLPRPPMPRFASGRLARALTAEPGLDGRKWTLAWEEIKARALEMNVDAGAKAAAKADAQVARWRSWTAGGQFDRSLGMPVAEARQIAGRVAAWAMEAAGGAGDQLLLAVAGAARAFSEAVDRLEQETLPALLLERILRQVLADGVQDPSHAPEEGGLRAIRAPGALWDGAPRVIWWGFVGPGERVSQHPWSVAELAAIEAVGVRLETSTAASIRIAASYAEVLQRTSQHVLLVRPALSRADRTVAHPLAHQLRPLLKDAAPEVYFRAERLLREGEVMLANRVLVRQPQETLDPPAARAAWKVPATAVDRLLGRRESATSLGRLVRCQLAWLTQDVLSLRSGAFAEIPRPDQLFGNLAHEIARQLLLPGAPPPLQGLREAASELFESLLPQMAALLQQPEYAGELAAARELVPGALESLVKLLHDRRLEVVGTEIECEADVGELALQGRLDILVRRDSRTAVLDLKWTGNDRRFREEIIEGRAIQLAVYRGIAGAEGSDGGYFLLRQRRILAPGGSMLSDDALDAARTEIETLQQLGSDWKVWRDLASKGIVLAAGVEGAADHRPVELGFEPATEPCRFCDLTSLCRVHAETL
jgi:ATP-dependent helicase/nuclease subunit B